ncbi:MAG: YbbR domain-containing protein [Bradymonadia bacterium]
MKSWLRAAVLNNLPLKVVALILSVTLVIIKRQESVSERNLIVPIRVTYPGHLVLVSPLVDKVEVRLRGPQWLLESVELASLAVNLTGVEQDTYTFEHALFDIPSGVSVATVRPPAMLVHFEQKKRKEVPVVADIQGEPEDAFRLVEHTVEPPTVVVEGAASRVDTLSIVRTLPVNLDQRARSVTVSRRLINAPDLTTYLNGGQTFKVTLIIAEKTSTRQLSGLPIGIRGEGPDSFGYEVSPPTASVTLFGPVRQLDALAPEQLAVFVNVAGTDPKKRVLKSREVSAAAPPDLVVREVRPGKVTLVQNDPPPPPPPPVDAGVPSADAGAPDSKPK